MIVIAILILIFINFKRFFKISRVGSFIFVKTIIKVVHTCKVG